MDGPVHWGEIHAATTTDQVGQTPEVGPDELCLLDHGYQDWMMVDEAICYDSPIVLPDLGVRGS
jgi:hypothetical protein